MSRNNRLIKLLLQGAMAGFVVSVLAGVCHADEFVYESKGRRDPFIPLVTPDGRLLKLDTHTEEKTNLALEGIIYDKEGLSYAMVGGFVLKVGDSLGDYRVLKIEPEKVVFIKDGVIEEVYLKKEEK